MSLSLDIRQQSDDNAVMIKGVKLNYIIYICAKKIHSLQNFSFGLIPGYIRGHLTVLGQHSVPSESQILKESNFVSCSSYSI